MHSMPAAVLQKEKVAREVQTFGKKKLDWRAKMKTLQKYHKRSNYENLFYENVKDGAM